MDGVKQMPLSQSCYILVPCFLRGSLSKVVGGGGGGGENWARLEIFKFYFNSQKNFIH